MKISIITKKAFLAITLAVLPANLFATQMTSVERQINIIKQERAEERSIHQATLSLVNLLLNKTLSEAEQRTFAPLMQNYRSYLRLGKRIDQTLNQVDSILAEQKAIEQTLTGLEDKILSLSTTDKQQLLREYKAALPKIANLKAHAQTLIEKTVALGTTLNQLIDEEDDALDNLLTQTILLGAHYIELNKQNDLY